jgi:branched-chain amino acid transport system permease protein
LSDLLGLLRRPLRDIRWGILPIPGRLLAVVFVVFLFVFPLITTARYPMYLMTVAALFTIFAVSWDVLSGYSGQVSFGHALFFGGGAYGSALLYMHLGWPPGATILLGTLIGTGIGVLTCFPALRLRPPYLSLLTMAFPIILERIIRSIPGDLAGGNFGIRRLPELAGSPVETYYICLVVMIISVLIMWKLTDAGSKYVRTGLIFHAIREDEIAARATGINTIRYKILAFAIAGFFASLAGALYAHYQTLASPAYFSLLQSFLAIIWVVFGGIVSIYGAVVGVYTLYVGTDFLRLTAIAQYQMLIMTVIVILILLFMPEGIAVWIRDKLERECPRCKVSNTAWRKECRACSANLR